MQVAFLGRVIPSDLATLRVNFDSHVGNAMHLLTIDELLFPEETVPCRNTPLGVLIEGLVDSSFCVG